MSVSSVMLTTAHKHRIDLLFVVMVSPLPPMMDPMPTRSAMQDHRKEQEYNKGGAEANECNYRHGIGLLGENSSNERKGREKAAMVCVPATVPYRDL